MSTRSGSLVTCPLSLSFWHLNSRSSYTSARAVPSFAYLQVFIFFSLEPGLFSLIPEIGSSKMSDVVYCSCFNTFCCVSILSCFSGIPYAEQVLLKTRFSLSVRDTELSRHYLFHRKRFKIEVWPCTGEKRLIKGIGVHWACFRTTGF